MTLASAWSRTPPVYTLPQLAKHVQGRITGDPRTEIHRVQPFERAGTGDLTLAAEKKYQEKLGESSASAVIVPLGVICKGKVLLQVEDPKVAFARLMSLFHPISYEEQGISPLACVGRGCRISNEVTVHPFVFLGEDVVIEGRTTLFPGVYVGRNCVIGEDCLLHPNVTLYDNVTLGSRVVIHSGTVIGADGFGYVRDGHEHLKIPQIGKVIIEDDVEIGANSCVDRATFGATVLKRGVKIDNHVHIGHNCRIGENTVIVAQVGISGSVKLGKDCVLGGQAGVVDHVTIGDNVRVMVKTAVTKDIPAHSKISGQPGMDHRRAMKIEAVSRRLPEIYLELKKWMTGSENKDDNG